MSGGDGGDDDGDALARAEATLLRKYFYTLYTVQRFRERARRGAVVERPVAFVTLSF
jgi:hypothetical protein